MRRRRAAARCAVGATWSAAPSARRPLRSAQVAERCVTACVVAAGASESRLRGEWN